MAISLRVVRAARDLDAVFRLRRRVFVEEEARFEHPREHIHDRFDAFGETVNILATDHAQPVATVRVTADSAVGLPAQELYDFRPLMEALAGGVVSIGWLCIRRDYRGRAGLLFGLFKLAMREARKLGGAHIIAPLHPEVLPMLTRLGARAVDEVAHCAELNVPIVPIHLDLGRLPAGVRETFHDPVDLVLGESNERRIYGGDEVVVRSGEAGTEAFVVMRGSARVVSPGAADDDPAARHALLGMGQLFGEVSLLDGGARTATVVAHSKELDVMVWSREAFLAQLQSGPSAALAVCGILGRRLRRSMEGYAGISAEESLIARVLLDASDGGQRSVHAGWLARQCGLWAEDLAARVAAWEREGLVRWRGAAEAVELMVGDVARLQEMAR